VILVDTGALVAICDPRDSKHSSALKHLEILTGEAFAACEAVMTETCFHLPHRSQRLRLHAFVREFGVETLPLTCTLDFWFDVFDWLAKYADHEPDWADACLAVLSGRDKTVKIWTYDREFRTTWRRPNGTTIPLAVK